MHLAWRGDWSGRNSSLQKGGSCAQTSGRSRRTGNGSPAGTKRTPTQLGWLHPGGATDNVPDTPGLGWSVTCDSLAVQDTMDVCDRGERQDRDDVESARVVEEFRSAVADEFEATAREFGRMAHESMEAFVNAARPAPGNDLVAAYPRAAR